MSKPVKSLTDWVSEQDTGGRQLSGVLGKVVLGLCVAWSLFQLWYASPLPFLLGKGILNDTEARSLHLGIALLLGFVCFPMFRGKNRRALPWHDLVLAFVGAFAGAYFLLFYNELATRPGKPILQDIVIATAGLVCLLEATRRAVGTPMVVLAIVFLAYTMLGRYMPDIIAHKGASLERMLSHQWLTTEGVYGVALGVSCSFIFIYVLFGALLDRAGAGNYMMQVSMAMLGHMRGGPAKVAVVSSGLNGLISGSSVSNVVSGGIFTIPLMKRAGYGGVKAGAIETMSSVNGQIMPPVMGAAAFLMVEYVGISYAEICKHAFLPAVLSYIALFYIVHLEAVKMGMEPFAKAAARPLRDKLTAWTLGTLGTVIVLCLIYFVAEAAKSMLGDAAVWVLGTLVFVGYVACVRVAARCPDLPVEIDVRNPVLPETWPTTKAGLHFLIPFGILIWCLMMENLSPGLSAFWAVLSQLVLMATHRPLTAFFRGQGTPSGTWRAGWHDIVLGMNDGARNMIGIAIATATAGIIVGGITLTGLGLRMTEFVEFVSQGNVLVMLLFTAFVCLVLGLGVPTTANYILVATLMAPVIVELGAQSGLVIPLVAVHLFVFYYGIMGDITPPVGLATFAASAISGEDAIKTGIQGSVYALRTVVLPFVWIFNPQLLLIDVHGWWELSIVVAASVLACLVFAAATMGWFRDRCRIWEIVALLLATFALFRPDFFMDLAYDPWKSRPARELNAVVAEIPKDQSLVLVLTGTNVEGDDITKTVSVQLGEPKEVRQRLAEAGVTFSALGDEVRVATVKFGSRAKRGGFEQGWVVKEIRVPSEAPSPHWVFLPAVLLVACIYFLQRRRLIRRPSSGASSAP